MSASKYSHQRIDIQDSNAALSKIYHLIDEGARVLDLGCSAGYLARELVERKKCRVIGADVFADDLQLAAEYCEQTLLLDLDSEGWAAQIEGHFDVIVLADVLEHLKYPQRVMQQLHQFLVPGGKVLVSIPNIAHASIRLELLQGSFAYEDVGILDDTHLKYWTRDTFLQLANEANLHAEQVDMVQKDLPRDMIERYLGSSEEALIQKLREPDALAYQYVFVLAPGKKNVISKSPKPLWEVEEKILEFHHQIGDRDLTIQAKEEAIAELTREIDQRQASIETLSEVILQKESAVQELSTVLGQRETSLKELGDELQKKEQAITELTGFVQQKEASLEVLDQSIHQKEAAIQELSGYLTQKEAAVQELGKALGSKEEEVKVLYSELDSLREQREELSIQVRSFDEQVRQQLQKLEQVQDQRVRVEQELKVLSGVLQSTQDELLGSQAQLKKREAQLERLVELHDRQHERIVGLQGTVQQQEDYMSSLNKAIAYNTEKISGLHHELSGVKHELSSVHQSLSYRFGRAVTFPLRWFFPVGSQRSQYLQTFLTVLAHPISTLRVFKKLGLRSTFKAFKTQSPEQLSSQLSRAIRISDSMVTSDTSLKRLKGKPRIAVMLHLYYTDLWPEALSYLQHLPYEYDLWVNLVSGSASEGELDELTREIRTQVSGARVIVSENRGRDMGGFIQLIQQMDLDQYDVFCKIHTKKSFHRQDGDVWRRDLLHSVLGEEVIRPVLDLFMADESIGVIGSQKYYMDFDPSVGTNDPFVRSLMKRFGIQEKKIEFIAGSMFWGRVEMLKSIRDAGFTLQDFAPENGAIDGNLEHAFERIFGSVCHQLGYRIHPLRSGVQQPKKAVKPICFYLPQYHEIPENDEWWGKGFTEWTQVKKAKELFSGHQVKRPHDDLGYYHLLDKQVRQQQGELARQYGVYGFCYHHYWFRGKLLLEKPLQLLLEDGYPDLPFCLNWANEPWTKRWDGLESEVLQPQDYGDQKDWKAHFEYLLPFFHHNNYIKVDGKPVFCLYRIGHIERGEEMIAYWRELAKSHGLPGLHIVQVLGSFADSQIDEKYSDMVDAVCEFQPNYSNYLGAKVECVYGVNTVDLQHSWDQISQQQQEYPVYYHGGFPGWDNSPRRDREGYVFQGGTMEEFELFLKRQFVKVMNSSEAGEPFFFLNAWNEWGEGCVMEPDEKQGYAALEALKNALAFCRYW